MAETTRLIRKAGEPKRVSLDFEGQKSITQQCFKDECDINKVLASYKKTGVITHIQHQDAKYADVSEIKGLQDAMQTVHEAEAAFMALPAFIRKQFDNDPLQFLEEVEARGSDDVMIELGLIEAPKQNGGAGAAQAPADAAATQPLDEQSQAAESGAEAP